MSDLIVEQNPPEEFRAPIAVLAFEGWNDAGSAATGAVRYLSWKLGARSFARINPEPFYDFQSSRPKARTRVTGAREIQWPQNTFSYARGTDGGPDLLLFLGVEPSLRWRTFSETISRTLERFDAKLVLSLGALLADVPHTRPSKVTGSAILLPVAERLNVSPSTYEGPTGIVGVLHRALAEGGVEAASLWANVPHYLTVDRCPPATLALLQRLETVLGRGLGLDDLVEASQRFQADVEKALADNPEARAYVEQLEAAHDSGDLGEDDHPSSPLPPAADIIGDLERFLRGTDDDTRS